MARGDSQTKALRGVRYERLRRKLLPLYLDLQRVDLNQRRKSPFNDEEAWDGTAYEDAAGRTRQIFSWQTVTDLLRAGRLSMQVETGGGHHPPRIEIFREDQ